jgi:hypothetical protein
VTLCAFDETSLRMAGTQIEVLQQNYHMENETFLIYHANELSDDLPAMSIIKNLSGVEVISLAGWYEAAFPHLAVLDRQLKPPEVPYFNRFKGFLCKPAAVLAADASLVAYVDQDAMLFYSPFDLMGTEIFNRTGSYFFRDRRLQNNPDLASYQYALVAAWKAINPRGTEIPSILRESPVFTGWGHEVGESAVFLYDKARQPRAAAALQRMLEPDLLDSLQKHWYGDKDMYWLSFALAELEPGLNPMDVVPIGQWFSNPVDPQELCCIGFAIGQILPRKGTHLYEDYDLFYVNGDAVETFMRGDWGDPEDLRLRIGHPVRYGDPQQEVIKLGFSKNDKGLYGHCFHTGHRAVSEELFALIHTYSAVHKKNATPAKIQDP